MVHYTDVTAFGGAEKMLLTLMQGLDSTRWRSLLLYHPHPGDELLIREARERNIEAVAVAAPRSRGRFAALAALRRQLVDHRPAIFHAHLAWPLRCTRGFAAAALAGVPHRVATQQLFVADLARRRVRRQRMVAAMVHRYIAVSEAMAGQLGPMIAAARKVTVVHNGVDPAGFDRLRGETARAELTGRVDRPLVLTLARLDRQKGLDTLLAAAVRLPDAVFAIAGEGPERSRLELEIERNGMADRFHLLGHRPDVPQLLAACDVFVLPSLFEGLPVSVLEAMAAQKPVVASAVGGTDEAVVDGVTGLLVPPGRPDELADAIGSLLLDTALAGRLGRAGRERVETTFSAASMVAGVERVYRELLGAGRAPGFVT